MGKKLEIYNKDGFFFVKIKASLVYLEQMLEILENTKGDTDEEVLEIETEEVNLKELIRYWGAVLIQEDEVLYSTPLQAQIMELHDQGLSAQYIWKTGIGHYTTIHRTIKKYRGSDTNANIHRKKERK